MLNSNTSSTCSHNMVNFGPLTAEIGSGVWCHPCKFQRVSRLDSVSARHSSSGRHQTLRRCCRSVRPSVTVVSPTKTEESIEIPFGLWTLVGPRNRVLDGCPDLPMGRGNFGGERTAHCELFKTGWPILTICTSYDGWISRGICVLRVALIILPIYWVKSPKMHFGGVNTCFLVKRDKY